MKKRKAYFEIQKALKTDCFRVVILLGLRKMGKTTLLKQLAEEHGGKYIDCREVNLNDAESYRAEIYDVDNKLILLDEIGHMDGFDVVLGHMVDHELSDADKKVVITSSAYGVMAQLARENLGGGRSHKVELFPLDFEEYLYFSDKIPQYGADYEPSADDVWDFFRLKGIPEGMQFVINEDYMEETFNDTVVAYDNKYGTLRDIEMTADQYRGVINVLAYSLNQPLSVKGVMEGRQVGVQEFGRSQIVGISFSESLIALAQRTVRATPVGDIGRIIAYLYHNGFLFADLAYNENARQDADDIRTDFLAVRTELDLKAVLNKYTLSVISPLIYTRLMVNLELIADKLTVSHGLLGELYELAAKAEVVYKDGYHIFHYTHKYYKDEGDRSLEVDIAYKTLLMELSVGHKKQDYYHVHKLFPENPLVRVVTDLPGVFENRGTHYLIGYPKALLLLSNNSILDLEHLRPGSQIPLMNKF